MKDRWCDECGRYGHRKWLWLGTHRTHRLYLRWYVRRIRIRMQVKKFLSSRRTFWWSYILILVGFGVGLFYLVK